MVLLRGEYRPITYDKKYDAVQKSDNWNIQSNSCMLTSCEAGMVLAAKGCKCHSAKNITKM